LTLAHFLNMLPYSFPGVFQVDFHITLSRHLCCL